MKIAVPKEVRADETRVAASPDMVKKFVGMGIDVAVQQGAGKGANMPDSVFRDAGASITRTAKTTYADADLILKVRRPMSADEGTDEVEMMPEGAVLVGLLAPLSNREQVEGYAKHKITSFAMELIPRISRAQSMDALSSQSNLAGYKAVIDAASEYGKAMPMMMTAAGTVAPAKVLILGAGVAGLQAIATARRLGAVVSAFDVRPAVKEQVQSLGAKFVEVQSDDAADAETAGGYAKEMSEDYKRKQSELIHETLKSQDIVITTALIPGRPAPVLITEDMVKDMKPGAVIVDMAVEAGGNCPLSELGKTVVKHDVKIIGPANLPGRIAADTSSLYARNLLNFITPMIDKEKKALAIDWEDEVVKGALLTRDGKVVNPALTGEGGS
mgnify:CR=1 FL=1